MNLVLLGYMGSGKSVVGKQLAKVLKFEHKDLDSSIEKQEGLSISEIFRKKGEIYFRRIEGEMLQSILANDSGTVISTGGGTPCYGNTMRTILDDQNTTSVYLKVSVAALTERLFREKAHRPLIAHLETAEALEDFIRKHLFERAYYYNQASMIVDADLLSETEVVNEIVARLF